MDGAGSASLARVASSASRARSSLTTGPVSDLRPGGSFLGTSAVSGSRPGALRRRSRPRGTHLPRMDGWRPSTSLWRFREAPVLGWVPFGCHLLRRIRCRIFGRSRHAVWSGRGPFRSGPFANRRLGFGRGGCTGSSLSPPVVSGPSTRRVSVPLHRRGRRVGYWSCDQGHHGPGRLPDHRTRGVGSQRRFRGRMHPSRLPCGLRPGLLLVPLARIPPRSAGHPVPGRGRSVGWGGCDSCPASLHRSPWSGASDAAGSWSSTFRFPCLLTKSGADRLVVPCGPTRGVGADAVARGPGGPGRADTPCVVFPRREGATQSASSKCGSACTDLCPVAGDTVRDHPDRVPPPSFGRRRVHDDRCRRLRGILTNALPLIMLLPKIMS